MKRTNDKSYIAINAFLGGAVLAKLSIPYDRKQARKIPEHGGCVKTGRTGRVFAITIGDDEPFTLDFGILPPLS